MENDFLNVWEPWQTCGICKDHTGRWR